MFNFFGRRNDDDNNNNNNNDDESSSPSSSSSSTPRGSPTQTPLGLDEYIEQQHQRRNRIRLEEDYQEYTREQVNRGETVLSLNDFAQEREQRRQQLYLQYSQQRQQQAETSNTNPPTETAPFIIPISDDDSENESTNQEATTEVREPLLFQGPSEEPLINNPATLEIEEVLRENFEPEIETPTPPNPRIMDAERFNTLMEAMTALTLAMNAGGNNENNENNNFNNRGATAPRIAVSIPVFKGEVRENVVAWLMQVETIFAAQNIGDANTRIHYASINMKDAAMHWYLQKIIDHDDAETLPWDSWNAFKIAVRDAFQLPNYQQYLCQQLRKIKQTSSEGIHNSVPKYCGSDHRYG